jgi:hypothetical protein
VTPRRIAIVGTRPPKSSPLPTRMFHPGAQSAHDRERAEWACIREDVEHFVIGRGMGTIIVSGGARGVDSAAASMAETQGFRVVIHSAEWMRLGKAAGMIRNGLIVADADEIHAWPSSWSRGTWDTIRKAKASGKPTFVHLPLEADPAMRVETFNVTPSPRRVEMGGKGEVR